MRTKPLPAEWIQSRILPTGALADLHDQAKGITLALLETGCRPSEMCNVAPGNVFLDEDIPYVHILPRVTSRTRFRCRRIPLVGVALQVFRRHPKGFPRYRGRADSYVATTNSYLREHSLLPGSRDSLRAFRFSFWDRLVEHGADRELRATLMGYRFDPLPPLFRSAAPMRLCQEVLSAMAFDFDPSIV